MPIYSFQCPTCGVDDRVLSIDEIDIPQICDCGLSMQRIMTSCRFKMVETGRQRVLDTLNYEHYRPGSRSPRSQAALTKGLDYEKPTIGRGFGRGANNSPS